MSSPRVTVQLLKFSTEDPEQVGNKVEKLTA